MAWARGRSLGAWVRLVGWVVSSRAVRSGWACGRSGVRLWRWAWKLFYERFSFFLNLVFVPPKSEGCGVGEGQESRRVGAETFFLNLVFAPPKSEGRAGAWVRDRSVGAWVRKPFF